MTDHKSIQIKLVTVLRAIGSRKCLEKANLLESTAAPITALHLRSLDLSSSNVIAIANCWNEDSVSKDDLIKSISFSYNSRLGDAGAIGLAKTLPDSICEIGLVNCGIGDAGAIELLHWMKKASNLQMMCIEQNHFSEQVRTAFKKLSSNNPQLLVVV